MNKHTVKVFAPATVANVGPGFDVLGLAINQLGDIVIAERTQQSGILFSLGTSKITVPTDKRNVVVHVAQCMLDELQYDFGVSLTLHKNMPIGSGLGSSGASCAAAAFAINSLLAKPLPKHDLIRFAMAGEQLASGAAHADNVAPSLLGGLCLITCYDPLTVINLPFSDKFLWVVAHPQLRINTQDARAVLPKQISIQTAMRQASHLSALITGLNQGDEALVKSSLQDEIAEPVRAPLIPGYEKVKQAALDAGAIGFSISGSGPAVFAITTTPQLANSISKNIQNAFKEHARVDCTVYISKINTQGAIIMEDNA